MTKDEALRLALEALQFALHVGFPESSESQIKKGEKAYQQHRAAITAIKEALVHPEQDGVCKYCADGCPACDARKLPEQEPVACPYCHNSHTLGAVYFDQNCVGCVKRMTTPLQRTWVGLTEKDICEAAVKSQEGISPRDDTLRFAIAIEAKLKEKNS